MPLKVKQLLQIFKDYWYELCSQNGSHMKFRNGQDAVMAPNHKELKPWTAQSILKDVCKQCNVSYQELVKKYNIKL